jgi:hypothetical protein
MLVSYEDIFGPVLKQFWGEIERAGYDPGYEISFKVSFRFYQKTGALYSLLPNRLTICIDETDSIRLTISQVFERIFPRFIDQVISSFSYLIESRCPIHLFQIFPVLKIFEPFGESKFCLNSDRILFKYLVCEEEINEYNKDSCKRVLADQIATITDRFDAIIVRFYEKTWGRWLKLISCKLIGDPSEEMTLEAINKVVDQVFLFGKKVSFFEPVPLYKKPVITKY